MTTTMKSLAEMTTSELWTLKAQVAFVIRERPGNKEAVNFWHAIDDELDRRGA